jgi:hypothetical protein
MPEGRLAVTGPAPYRASLLALFICATAFASPSIALSQSTEREAILFVQTLAMKDGQQGIHLIWVPQPLQSACLGKTAQQCAEMDYCIRTTNRDDKRCHSLAVPLSRLPSYPPGMIPGRQLSVVLVRLSPDRFPKLQDFVRHASRASLEHLSMSARVKARIRFIRKPDDDDFDVLDILAVAPF